MKTSNKFVGSVFRNGLVGRIVPHVGGGSKNTQRLNITFRIILGLGGELKTCGLAFGNFTGLE